MQIRVAAYGVVLDNGRILLAHWNQNGAEGWTLPGGGLEFGEHPVDAAVREIAEETGYTASVDRLLGIDTIAIPAVSRFDGSGVPMQALRIIYRASVVGGALASERDGSTDEAAWFDVDDLASVHTVDLVSVGIRLAREAPADGRL
ncbi:NUDIX hydrolase [Planctomonas psychrotolerans]|uniref:NUDIX hydrolase n=1 Tax=Planctomonas psychrotolerans TaxID=2528712 RepID=UPI001D0D4A1D|nr:NUDIX domain-containing protein [Planctomonas psychrotolerans]